MGVAIHSLAGYSNGLVYAWGYGQLGGLGDNTKTAKSSPIAVAGSRSFDEIATGGNFSLALDISDGSVWVWGYNAQGQLGDNTTTGKSSPIAVAGSRSFDKISAGNKFSLALDASDGLVYAWGYNNDCELGDNTRTNKSSPIAVAGSRSFDVISGGQRHSLAIDASTGLAYAWGYNGQGQCGTGVPGFRESSPIAVAGSRSFDKISAGGNHSLALDALDGLVYAWGNNVWGQLGDNSTTVRISPVAVAGSRSFAEIATGGDHSIALDISDGSAWAWGQNTYGQLGDNTTTGKSSPTAVAGSRSFDKISAGSQFSLALDASDGLVYAWGYNNFGNLGDNTTVAKSSPIAVAGSRSFTFLSVNPPPPPLSNLICRINVEIEHKNLVCRVNVYYTIATSNLICRINTVAFGSTNLISRLISLKVTNKNLVSRLTSRIVTSKNIISRLNVYFIPSSTNLVCRLSTTGWGRVKVQVDEIALSPVKDTGNTDTKKITINTNTYQTGSGTGKIYVRGQAATFIQDAESPAWEEYTVATEKEWRYIQLKIATS